MQEMLNTELTDSVLSDPDIDAKKNYPGGMIQIMGPEIKTKSGVVHEYISYTAFQTAAKQSKIESKTFHIAELDEAQDADDLKAKKSILPMLASVNGLCIMSGTPNTRESFFRSTIQKNKLKDIGKKPRFHFEYDYLTVQKYNKYYKAHIDRMKEEMGEESDEFRMSYKLEWLLSHGMAMTTEMFEEYMMDKSKTLEMLPEQGFTYVAGLDFARKQDYTVLTIAKLIKVKINDKGEDVYKNKLLIGLNGAMGMAGKQFSPELSIRLFCSK